MAFFIQAFTQLTIGPPDLLLVLSEKKLLIDKSGNKWEGKWESIVSFRESINRLWTIAKNMSVIVYSKQTEYRYFYTAI